MRGVNKVILLGNLGNDPEVRTMFDGRAVANFNIATSRSWTDKDGNKQESTEWHRCVAFGKTAEIVGEYLKKGSQTYVEGSLKTRKWKDKEGHDRYTTEVDVIEFQMVGGRRDEAGGAKPTQKAQPSIQGPEDVSTSGGARGYNDIDDDIPFAPLSWLA